MALTRLGTNSITALPSGVVDSAALASGVGGSLVKLSTQTASADTSVEFTTGIDSTYKMYQIHYFDIQSTVDGNHDFNLAFSSDGGSNYNMTVYYVGMINYVYDDGTQNSGAFGHSAHTSTNTTSWKLGERIGLGGSSKEGTSGVVTLFNPTGTSLWKQCENRYHNRHSENYQMNTIASCRIHDTAAVNALKFSISSDAMNGTFILYGVA